MIDKYGNNVFLISGLPVKGAVTENEDNSYTIFINANQSDDGIMKTYYHELGHILNHDFEKHDVQQIEAEAHNMKGEYIWQRKKEFQE